MADVVVVGAGAAGIIAAWRAASLGAKVLLLEKTNRLGTKILISGGGKCNIAHDGPMGEVLQAFRQNEGRWLKASCYAFPNHEILRLFTARGLDLETRPDGRVFPARGNAKDVVAILRTYLEDAGVEMRFEAPVTGLQVVDGRVTGVQVGDELIPAPAVIIGSGGSSYPGSGTTGDGWRWLRDLGHSVVKVRAALAPMYLRLEETDPTRAGVALREVLLKAKAGTKEIARWQGDLLFTHHGISGPCALGISRAVAEKMEDNPVALTVDLAPQDSHDELSRKIQEWQREHPKRRILGYLEGYVPERLAPALAASAEIPAEETAWGISAKARNRLVECLKAWRLGNVRVVPLEKGEVVAGGIDLNEVDPRSMRSLKVDGLYVCGEILDIAGPVGGYNLQAAFSTGYAAGQAAASQVLGR